MQGELEDKISSMALQYGYERNELNKSDWAAGNINTTTGEDGTATSTLGRVRIRTIGYLDGSIECVKYIGDETGNHIFLFRYASDDDHYIDYTAKTKEFLLDDLDYTTYKYRLSLARVAYGEVDAALENYVFLSEKSDVITEPQLNATVKEITVNAKAMRYGYAYDVNDVALWEQGMINSTTGVNSPSTAASHNLRIRTTEYIDTKIEQVTTETGFIQVYEYNENGSFIRVSGFVTKFADFRAGYRYRVVFASSTASSIVASPEDATNVLFLNTATGDAFHQSVYYKKVNYGKSSDLHGYYSGQGTDYTLFDKQTKSADVFDEFDSLVEAYPNYIVRTDLGEVSKPDGYTPPDNWHIYSYRFTPKQVSNSTAPILKVLIISAQHGFEKSSVYGLYYLLRDMCESWTESGILDYLRHHVEFIVIPIVNRYGFDENTYTNGNGINLNRNYDTPEFTSDPSSSEYGGVEPFDQPETMIVKNVVEANTDAVFFFDWHTNGENRVAEYANLNWLSMTHFDRDGFLSKMVEAGAYHIANETAHMTEDYSFQDIGTAMCGYMTITAAERATAGRWVRYALHMAGMTFETNNGFPGAVSYSADEQKANSEIMGNWLATLFNTFANAN